MIDNIFSLFRENNQQVPFVVHRHNWSTDYGLVVTSVTLNKRGPYGTAVGFGLPPLNGQAYNDYWGTPDAPKQVNCAGCGQWRLADEIPEAWKSFIDHAASEPR